MLESVSLSLQLRLINPSLGGIKWNGEFFVFEQLRLEIVSLTVSFAFLV